MNTANDVLESLKDSFNMRKFLVCNTPKTSLPNHERVLEVLQSEDLICMIVVQKYITQDEYLHYGWLMKNDQYKYLCIGNWKFTGLKVLPNWIDDEIVIIDNRKFMTKNINGNYMWCLIPV